MLFRWLFTRLVIPAVLIAGAFYIMRSAWITYVVTPWRNVAALNKGQIEYGPDGKLRPVDPAQHARDAQLDYQRQMKQRYYEETIATEREGAAAHKYKPGQFVCPGMILQSYAGLYTVTAPAKILRISKVSANVATIPLRFALQIEGRGETFTISPESDPRQRPRDSCSQDSQP